MSRSSAETRQVLYAAGLRRFATEGWRSARVRDIVADAGQANDSAINYHFGSRSGLLGEILNRGVTRMEDERRADLERWTAATPELGEVVRGVVAPLADLLLDDEGRCLLRVIAQVGPLAEAGRTVTAAPVEGTVLQEQLALLVAGASQRCGEEVARHRVRQLVVMATSELAVRAEGEVGDPPSHAEYVADLIDWLALGLARPRVAVAENDIEANLKEF